MELLVVLVLLGVILAAAAPALPRQLEGTDAAVGALRRAVDRARRLSAEQGRAVRLDIDFATGAYRITPADPMQRALLDSGRLRLPNGVRVSREQYTALFDPLGRTNGDSLRLTDGAGREATVALSPWTGAVRHDRR